MLLAQIKVSYLCLKETTNNSSLEFATIHTVTMLKYATYASAGNILCILIAHVYKF